MMNPTVIPAIFLAKDKMSAAMARMSKNVRKFAKDFQNAGKEAFKFGKKAFITGAVIAAPLVLAGKAAVDFEDKMSDIGKTTGLQGRELKDFGDDILKMSTKTRSSIDDLATIAEIGGRLGIVGKKDLKAFTVSANEFAVALGGDFSGGVESAITQFGKVTSLFRDTKDLDIAPALKKAGSAMNALSAKGVNVEGLTDFSLRVGALPEVFRPSLASTAALGATLQKAGIDSQIASSGFSNFISIAAENLPAFANAMGISQKEAQQLINTDTAAFFAQFSAKMKGVPADQLAIKLKKLKLNSLEVRKAVGGMSGSLELYTELSALSNEQLEKGTSITQEYNTKNNNTAGKIAKLKNQFMALAITVGNALLPVVSELISSISPYLQGASDWMQRNKGLASSIAKIAVGIAGFTFAVSGASYAVGAFQKALVFLSNPIGLVVAGVVALVAVYASYKNSLSEASTAENLVSEVKQRAIDKSIDQRYEAMELFRTMRKAKEGTDEYKTALSAVEQMQPGITEKYNLQTKSVKELNNAEKELTRTIMARAIEEAKAEIYKEKIKEAIRREAEGPGWMDKLAAVGATMGSLSSMVLGGNNGRVFSAQDVVNVDVSKNLREASVLQGSMEDGNSSSKIANPEQAKQQSMVNNMINIVFSGPTEGVTAMANGKKVPISSGVPYKFAGSN